MRCQGTSKRSGEQCKKDAMLGKDVCHIHGGKTPDGIASPHFKHGRKSRILKDLPERYRAAFTGHLEDEHLHGLDAEIALLDTMIGELLNKMQSGDGGNMWRQSQTAFQRFRQIQGNSEIPPERRGELMSEALNQLENLLVRGSADHALRNEIVSLVEKRRGLVDSAAKLEYQRSTVLSTKEAALLAAYLARATVAAIDGMPVDDKHKRKAKQEVQNDFRRLMTNVGGV